MPTIKRKPVNSVAEYDLVSLSHNGNQVTSPYWEESPPAGQHVNDEGQYVRWHLDLRSPATMITLFVAGTGVAIGHHLFYQSLDGKQVANVDNSEWSLDGVRNSQEWKIRFGTAFAFVAKTMFAAAVAFAYNQHVWTTATKKPLSIAGLDALFGAVNDIFAFKSFEYLSRAKLAALLAAFTWLIPLSALITPATLTVVPSTTNSTRVMTVPSIDFSNVAPLFSFENSAIESDANSADNGVTPYMSRIMSSTASGLNILPMKAIASNATYSLTFNGPSLRCDQPSQSVEDFIYEVLNITTGFNSEIYMTTKYDTPIAWLAFPPISQMLEDSQYASSPPGFVSQIVDTFVISCITGEQGSALNTTVITDGTGIQCEGISNITGYNYNNGQIWVWAQNQTYNCSLTDTQYDVTFNSLGDTQTVDPLYTFSYTDAWPNGSYFAIVNTLANWLTGMIRGYNKGVLTYKTRITETALIGAFRAAPNSDIADSSGLPPSIMTDDLIALARNKSMGSLIEELSRNLTLSLFSADQVLSSSGMSTNVTFTNSVNVYAYSRLNLLLTYAVAFAVTLFGVIIGLLAYVKNGVSHNTSFSSILTTTRNKELDHLTRGQSMGAIPLSDMVSKVRLRFGLLPRRGDETAHRVGFGLEDEIVPLAKGVDCY